MRPFLTALLYDPQAASRAYLRWDRVEPLLNSHFSGHEDWLDFVGALTVFEIAHRLWVEPRELPYQPGVPISTAWPFERLSASPMI